MFRMAMLYDILEISLFEINYMRILNVKLI